MSIPIVEKLEDLILPFIKPSQKVIDKVTSRLTEEGENYGSLMLKIDFILKDQATNKEETLSTVAKLIPELELYQKIFNIQVTFKNEIAFYDTIVPTMQEFQKQQGVSDVVDFFPKMYGARINLNNGDVVDTDGVLLIENLQPLGYGNINRRVGCDYETTKLILKDLAKFHAIPVAIKLVEPEIFEKKIRPHFLCSFGDRIKISSHHNPSEVIKNVVEDSKCSYLLPKIKESLKHLHQTPRQFKEPFASMGHRDFWINNCMIKFKDGIPVKTKLLDFQNYSYDSPARDVLFFLGTSVQTDILRKHLDEFIKYYHEIFFETLASLNCPRVKLTYDDFLQEVSASAGLEIAHIAFFVLLVAFGNISPRLATKDDVAPEAKERFFWVLEEFEKRNWLNF